MAACAFLGLLHSFHAPFASSSPLAPLVFSATPPLSASLSFPPTLSPSATSPSPTLSPSPTSPSLSAQPPTVQTLDWPLGMISYSCTRALHNLSVHAHKGDNLLLTLLADHHHLQSVSSSICSYRTPLAQFSRFGRILTHLHRKGNRTFLNEFPSGGLPSTLVWYCKH